MKKVLIVTYYWPPAGGPGVQRWLKFVKYLREFDVEPVVFIPANPSYPMLDKSFEKEVPNDIKILKSKILEPYSFANIFSKKDTEVLSSGIISEERDQSSIQKLLLYIRGNCFIPDARKFWITPSVKKIERELKKDHYDAVITTGPPHSVHLIGLRLKKNLGVKWIADFRDPWTQIGYHNKLKLTKSSQQKHRRLEKEVLNTADKILVTSFTTQQEFREKTSRPVRVITNGFDQEVNTERIRSEYFEVSHIGSLLSGRNPENLWKVLSEIVKENETFRSIFKLRLAGRVSETVLKSIDHYQLTPFLANEGYVDHDTAVSLQRQASVLLLIEIDSNETRGIIPGKLFEYLSATRPILAIGPKRWDAGQIISETCSGKTFTYSEKSGIKEFLLKKFEQFQAKENFKIDVKDLQKYHRRSLTEQLAHLIKKL